MTTVSANKARTVPSRRKEPAQVDDKSQPARKAGGLTGKESGLARVLTAAPTDRLASAAEGASRTRQAGPASMANTPAPPAAGKGANPLAALLPQAQQAGAAVARPRLGAHVGMHEDAAPSPRLRHGLLELESIRPAVAGRDTPDRPKLGQAVDKIRHGMFLTTSDAVDALAADGKLPRSAVESMTDSLKDLHIDANVNALVIEKKLSAAVVANARARNAHFPSGVDVNALVELVLRESYMGQLQDLKAHADRVKYYNELKKSLRAKKMWAMQLKMAEGEVFDEPPTIWDSQASEWRYFGFPEAAFEPDATEGAGGDVDNSPPTSPVGTTGSAQGSHVPAGTVELPRELRDYFQRTQHVPPQVAANSEVRWLWGWGQFDVVNSSWADARERWSAWMAADDVGDGVAIGRFSGSNEFGFELIGQAADKMTFEQFRRILSLAMSNDDTGGGRLILRKLLENCTPQFLARFIEIKGGSLTEFRQFDGAAQRKLAQGQQELQAIRAATDGLWGEWKTDPQLTDLAHLFAEYTVTGSADILEQIKTGMFALSSEDAQAFLAGVADNSNGDSALVNGLLKACDPAKVFGEAAPADWQFLESLGGACQGFFHAWIDFREETTPSAKDRLSAGRDLVELANVAVQAQSTQFTQQPGTPAATETQATGSAIGASSPAIDPEDEGAYWSDPNGRPRGTPPGPQQYTDAAMKSYVESLEESLKTVGDDAQLANVDLQNMLQKQQQTLQMMSNIGKVLHDTAMSIIRKIGG